MSRYAIILNTKAHRYTDLDRLRSFQHHVLWGMCRSHQDKEARRFALRESDVEVRGEDAIGDRKLTRARAAGAVTRTLGETDRDHRLRHNTTVNQGC